MHKQIQVQSEIIPAYGVLHLSGYINTIAEEEIELEVQRLLEMKCPYLLLDFEQVEHINSAGITILIGIAARVGEIGGRLGAYGLNQHFQKIFHMVGLDEYILIGQKQQDVLEKLKKEDSGGSDLS